MVAVVSGLPAGLVYCDTPLGDFPRYCRVRNCPSGLPGCKTSTCTPDCPVPSGSATGIESIVGNRGLFRLVILLTLWEAFSVVVQEKSPLITGVAVSDSSIPLLLTPPPLATIPLL